MKPYHVFFWDKFGQLANVTMHCADLAAARSAVAWAESIGVDAYIIGW